MRKKPIEPLFVEKPMSHYNTRSRKLTDGAVSAKKRKTTAEQSAQEKTSKHEQKCNANNDKGKSIDDDAGVCSTQEDTFQNIILIQALWGCALARGPQAEYSGDLYDMLMGGMSGDQNQSGLSDDAYLAAVRKLTNAIRDNCVFGALATPMIGKAETDENGLPFCNDFSFLPDSAEQVFERFALAQEEARQEAEKDKPTLFMPF